MLHASSTGRPSYLRSIARHRPLRRASILFAVAVTVLCAPAGAAAAERPFLTFPRNETLAETVPSNGDQNPYGVALVPTTTGKLRAGSVLVSNFNNAGESPSGNLQGLGTTIVQVEKDGKVSLFAQLEPKAESIGQGLTTALAVLPGGYVVVGSLPTTDGKAATAKAGGLIILDSAGEPVGTITGAMINGPWDLTAASRDGQTVLFVTNVLNGTAAAGGRVVDEGTVVRIALRPGHGGVPTPASMTVVARGFPERTDPVALVVGPTGVALAPTGVLYVADTQGDRIAAIPDALGRSTALEGAGITVAEGGYLAEPLGLALTPEGNLLATNAASSDIVEVTPEGAEFQPYDTGAGEGGLFGLAVLPAHAGVVYVDDNANTLKVLR